MRVRRRTIRISAEAHDRFSAAAAARGLRLSRAELVDGAIEAAIAAEEARRG